MGSAVSPTSIRSRILKGHVGGGPKRNAARFTHVDPFEDTERQLAQDEFALISRGFTHVDPFEDTESRFPWSGRDD